MILTFFASMYQHPEIKLKWMLTLIGDKGLGKNKVEEILGQQLLYTENYMRAGNKDHLFNKFNAIFETNLLTVEQEIIWDGDQKHDSILKEWTTEGTRTIERKGIDPYTVQNRSQILMTSNSDWVVPTSGKKERRYAVLRIKDIRYTPEDWTRLYAWAKDNKGAIMHYLMNFPLDKNYHIQAPYTPELENQLRHSLNSVELYIFNGISNGYFGVPKKHNHDIGEVYVSDQGIIPAKKIYDSYIQSTKSKESITKEEFGRNLSGKNRGKNPLLAFIRKRQGKDKITMYRLKSREECADVFYQATGVSIELDNVEWPNGQTRPVQGLKSIATTSSIEHKVLCGIRTRGTR